jgi:Zn-dependent protease
MDRMRSILIRWESRDQNISRSLMSRIIIIIFKGREIYWELMRILMLLMIYLEWEQLSQHLLLNNKNNQLLWINPNIILKFQIK